MTRFAIALCALSLFLAGATTMFAQDSTYDVSALRVESSMGDLQIVRGAQSTVVARAGVFHGPKLAQLVARSDRAAAEARVFEQNYDRGQYTFAAGLATLGAAVGASRIRDLNGAIRPGLTAASVLLIAYGGSKLERASQALSRAIWWYNRDLKRE